MYEAVHSHREFSLIENNDLTFSKMQNCYSFLCCHFDTLLQVAENFIPQVPGRHVIYYYYHYKNINVIKHTSLKNCFKRIYQIDTRSYSFLYEVRFIQTSSCNHLIYKCFLKFLKIIHFANS